MYTNNAYRVRTLTAMLVMVIGLALMAVMGHATLADAAPTVQRTTPYEVTCTYWADGTQQCTWWVG